MLQPMQRAIMGVGRSRRLDDGDHESGEHAGNRRVHARLQDRIPQHDGEDQIGDQVHHPGPVETIHDCHHSRRSGQPQRCETFGVEQGDDRNRSHVIHDRNGDQKELERSRRTLAQQGQHAHGEGNVGSRRNGPAVHDRRIASGFNEIDDRRCGHARDGGDDRQPALVPGRKPTIDQLPLDLQPDIQEEDDHQAIVDPKMRGHRPQLCCQHRALDLMQHMVVKVVERAVGDDHGDRSRQDEDDPARRLAVQELAQRRCLAAARYPLCAHVCSRVLLPERA